MRHQGIWKQIAGMFFAVAMAGMSGTLLWSQGQGEGGPRDDPSPFLAPPNQVVAIRAGRLYDSKSGTLANNQIILIRGDRVAEIGPSVQIPAGAKVYDLSGATVLPGMVDTHVHVFPQRLEAYNRTRDYRMLVAVNHARTNLDAGFTTVVDMDSRGGYGTVDLRNAINRGLIQGPRMQVSGASLNFRGSSALMPPEDDAGPHGNNINSPWLARTAVRERKVYGADWIKIYSTMDYAGEEWHEFRPDASLVAIPTLTKEEIEAIVDEAHRLDMKVACHTYGGQGLRDCVNAGVDATQHALALDDQTLQTLVQKKLPLVMTLDDLVGLEALDNRITRGRNTRIKMGEASFKKAHKAGISLPFGSGVTRVDIPHGKQADQFGLMVKWGMTPAEALNTAFMEAAKILNYGWDDRVGSLEKGKYADVIAVSGNPLTDIREMERVKFVMKGGILVKNTLN